MTQAVVNPKRNLVWVVLIALNLALILHLAIYLVGSFPEFDTGSRIKLWIGIAAALGSITLAARLIKSPLVIDQERWHTPFLLASAGLLLVLALIPIPPFTYSYLAHVHTLLTITASVIAFYVTLFDADLSLRKPRIWLIVAIIGVVVVSLIRAHSLSAYPFIDVQDEPWVTAWTVNWMQTGHFGDPTLGGLGDAYYAYPRFYWLMGLWMRLVGVGLWQGRLLGFLLIFPVIGLTAAVAREWYGKTAAILTAAFLFCSAVLLSAARIRHDIGLTVCLAASLWLYTLAVKRNRLLLHWVAGLVMAWGMFSHYHAAGLGVVLFVGLYLPDYIDQVRQRSKPRYWLPETGALLYALGGILGGLSVFVIQLLPDFDGWLWALRHQALYSSSGGEFFIAFFGNILNIAFFSIFEFLLVAAGVVAAVRRRHSRDVTLLLILILGHIALAVMGSGAIYYYILPLTPIYGMLVGAIWLRRQDALPSAATLSRRLVTVFLLLLIPLFGITTGRSLQALLNGDPVEPAPPAAVQWIRANAPANAGVVADMYYYFWLRDYQFTSHLVPDYLYPENIERLKTLDAIWGAVDMDYLVVDPNYTRSYIKYFQPLLATKLIADDYTIVAQIPTEKGTVTIYKRTANTS